MQAASVPFFFQCQHHTDEPISEHRNKRGLSNIGTSSVLTDRTAPWVGLRRFDFVDVVTIARTPTPVIIVCVIE
jgi:hypothetical protein